MARSHAERVRLKRNWAVAESRPEPGTIRVYPATDSRPVGVGLLVPDDFEARFQHFRKCLEALQDLKPSSVGFPFRIGCGLAGGSWPRYERALKAWSDAHPTVDVRVYAL